MFVEALLARWEATLPGHAAVGIGLLARYGEPHRSYHDVAHLQHVLEAVAALRDEAADTEAVELAAWFHDAVYDPHRRDNEEQSARLAVTSLSGVGLESAKVQEVARLVRLTAGHNPEAGDADGAVLCDADLSVLASDPARYAAYVAGVRAEYAHLDDATFAAARATVLRALADLRPLFRTATGCRRWESAARANVAAELATLLPPP